MPFAGANIPSIQLGLLESYLKKRDINITSKHLYLKAADIYGIDNYNFLIYPPNDSYNAQMIFSKFVFPNHWKQNIDKFRNYFNKEDKIFVIKDIKKYMGFIKKKFLKPVVDSLLE